MQIIVFFSSVKRLARLVGACGVSDDKHSFLLFPKKRLSESQLSRISQLKGLSSVKIKLFSSESTATALTQASECINDKVASLVVSDNIVPASAWYGNLMSEPAIDSEKSHLHSQIRFGRMYNKRIAHRDFVDNTHLAFKYKDCIPSKIGKHIGDLQAQSLSDIRQVSYVPVFFTYFGSEASPILTEAMKNSRSLKALEANIAQRLQESTVKAQYDPSIECIAQDLLEHGGLEHNGLKYDGLKNGQVKT